MMQTSSHDARTGGKPASVAVSAVEDEEAILQQLVAELHEHDSQGEAPPAAPVPNVRITSEEPATTRENGTVARKAVCFLGVVLRASFGTAYVCGDVPSHRD